MNRSLDDPPKVPIFVGGREKPTQVQALTTAVAEMAKAITSPTNKNTPISSDGAALGAALGISPGKIANLRASYLQQMRDLHSLYECGAVTEAEFREQKTPILEQLKKLTP